MDLTKPKRMKLDCVIIHPDLTEERSKTPLYKESSHGAGGGPSFQEGVLPPPPQPLPEELEIPTSHMDRIHGENIAWESTRDSLIQAYCDLKIPRTKEVCAICKHRIDLHSDHLRCMDCAAHAYFCSEACMGKMHQQQLLCFHKPEVWKVIIIWAWFVV